MFDLSSEKQPISGQDWQCNPARTSAVLVPS